MKIRLNEIPQEGRSYIFDRESGELNATLNDLIGQHAYKVELFIKPIGNAYEMRGKLNTSTAEICSKCGWDFDLALDRSIHEILFEEDDSHRKTQSVHGNQAVDFLGGGPSMTPVRGDVFDAGEFVHEIIALAEPFYPLCGGEKCDHIEEVEEIQRKIQTEFQSADEKTEGHPAFSVLKSLEVSIKKN